MVRIAILIDRMMQGGIRSSSRQAIVKVRLLHGLAVMSSSSSRLKSSLKSSP